jgi:hypothetical protein
MQAWLWRDIFLVVVSAAVSYPSAGHRARACTQTSPRLLRCAFEHKVHACMKSSVYWKCFMYSTVRQVLCYGAL